MDPPYSGGVFLQTPDGWDKLGRVLYDLQCVPEDYDCAVLETEYWDRPFGLVGLFLNILSLGF